MAAPENTQHRPGGALFAMLFLIMALGLLSQLGAETKFSAKTIWSKKLFAQPAFWPAVGVIGMAGFGALHLVLSVLRRTSGTLTEAALWLRPVEYLAWFMVYVFAVPQVGYLAATVIFTTLLALRAGYRSARMLGLAAATGLGIVLIFKTALSVKIPGGAIYEHLQDALRNFMIVNF